MPRSRRPSRIAAGLAAVALTMPGAVAAQSTISTALDTTLVTVGDRMTLEVRVRHPADAAVSWPDSVDVAPFEVLEARVRPVEVTGDEAVSSTTFSLTTFELGEVELPPFSLRVLHPDGREEMLETDRYGVEVVSVGVEEGSDIREIRGPLAIPLTLLQLLSWALGLMILVAGLYALIRRLRGTEEGGGAVAGPPPRPPHEVALEELDGVEASGLLAEGRIKEFHIRVSEIIRHYLEARFHVRALEMTTWEVLGGLQAAGVDEGIRRELRRFLDQCDLVKFAKARPGEAESRAVLELGRDLVRSSTPTPVAASMTEGAP